MLEETLQTGNGQTEPTKGAYLGLNRQGNQAKVEVGSLIIANVHSVE